MGNILKDCDVRNKLRDTFAVDHLLSKLNSQTVKVISCLSPVNNINLPYFANYIDSSSISDKEFLCIPLCDGVHFEGYVVNVMEQKIIHIDSLGFKHARNPTSSLIEKILFEDGLCETFVSFESFCQTRRQFDSNSCGVWLVAAICSYITCLPEILDRGDAFDICYNLLNHVSEAPDT